MKRHINTALSFNKDTKSLLIISLLFFFISQVYSQTNLPKRAKLKTITYSGYNISGYVYKKHFVEDQKLTFIARTNSYNTYPLDTILSGRFFYADDGNSYIVGIKIERGYSVNRRTKGIFKITNIKNGVGITANKKEGYKLEIRLEELTYYQDKRYYYNYDNYGTLILQKHANNKFSLKIKYEALILETIIPDSLVQKVLNYNFNNYILDSHQVKLSFNNGDVFIGTVKKPGSYDHYSANFIPDSGEYRYATGEVFNGKIYYSNVFYRFLPDKGSFVFTDGTIDDENWLKKYVYILSYTEQEDLFRECKSLTELRDKTKIIYDKKKKKTEKEEEKKEKAKLEELQKHLKRQEELVAKYGNYYGNKILEGELALGMSQEMVNEYWPKKHFNISYINRNNDKIVIWEFDKKKMQGEIIKEGKENGKEEGALAIILMLNLSEQFGGLDVPKMLVFKNNKLTEIYR